MGRSYGVSWSRTCQVLSTDLTQDAVAALNTLQSNHSIVDAIRKSGRGMNKQAIPEMIDWCQRAGYEVGLFALVQPVQTPAESRSSHRNSVA